MRVVVSTHLDDAVLSCYSLLGPETVVVTVLAGVPPESCPLGEWDELGGAASSRERVLERRAEDEQALSLSGAAHVHLDFFDSQYWDWLPRPTVAELAAGLRRHLTGEIYAPAGIGNTDHVLVREAVRAVSPGAVLYADLPYALRHGFGDPGRDVELDDATVEQKIAAARCYATQIDLLAVSFGDFLAPEAVRRERWLSPRGLLSDA